MTIAEIAKRAGVSKTAVSRYLNNGYVSGEKREAIKRAIEETGYVPSRQAQMLRTGKSKTVGVIIPRIDSETVSRIVAGISMQLEQNGYHLLLANTENKAERELEYLDVFHKGNVDGIIFVATILSEKHRKAVRASAVPIVLVGQQMDGVNCVFHDDLTAAREMTGLLVANGRTRIGYIGVTPKDKAAGAARREGYLQALRLAGFRDEPALMEQCNFSMEGGRYAAERLLARAPDIDGVFCATDSIAVGAMRLFQESGRCVPRDIAVTGIGHSRLSELVSPRLTTAHYYYRTSGEEAARDLLQMIEKGKDQARQLRLGFRICKQESCK